eukprot:gnl/MRDRNA2_/MRDRNA2_29370_c0_seq1.p1 gnl/MRDRNA2_/MRDRNA2_29370_c0~~gnl/MRDRNA2_/MRDRNA2_29370_c0_seq1.p1  ORF type:complete len:153 (+),score=30.52 gnl/MRDRNA2_/MRDRNA2_29370_c0_seq1:102-560(+)
MGRDSRSRSRGGGADEAKIQDMVDERQQCRRDRDFDKADRIRDELRDMGVRVDDTELTWEGPNRMRGKIANGKGGGGGGKGGGKERRPGDWDCPNCGKLVFASKEECFACGTRKGEGGRGRDRDRRRDSRDRGRGRRDDDDRDRRRRRSYSR